MAVEVAKRLIDVYEYYKMAEVGILKPTDNVELIKGEIIEMSPVGSKHASIVNRLVRILNQAFNLPYTHLKQPSLGQPVVVQGFYFVFL